MFENKQHMKLLKNSMLFQAGEARHSDYFVSMVILPVLGEGKGTGAEGFQ